jgi:hypothetical protein
MAATIQTTELQNLPMVTRTITGMLELLPGASPVASLHRTKDQTGSVSYAGGSGGNVAESLDGADNRDNHYSGPLMSFSTESLESSSSTNQFRRLTPHEGASVTMVTKSGTNQMHGTAFGHERDKRLIAKTIQRAWCDCAAVQPPAAWRFDRRSSSTTRCSSFGAIESIQKVGTFSRRPLQPARFAGAAARSGSPAGWNGLSEPSVGPGGQELPADVQRQGERSAEQQAVDVLPVRRPE